MDFFITFSKSTFLPCDPIPNQNRGRHAEGLLSSLSLSSISLNLKETEKTKQKIRGDLKKKQNQKSQKKNKLFE